MRQSIVTYKFSGNNRCSHYQFCLTQAITQSITHRVQQRTDLYLTPWAILSSNYTHTIAGKSGRASVTCVPRSIEGSSSHPSHFSDGEITSLILLLCRWSRHSMLVPTCLIASAAGHLFGNECLGRDHAESGMMQPLPCMHCWALSSTQRWQRWDHFRLCDVSLHCDKWE